MAKLSGAAVLLLLLVPLCMYTCALLVGVQLGRALERRPDGVIVTLSIGEALGYVVAEVGEQYVVGCCNLSFMIIELCSLPIPA